MPEFSRSPRSRPLLAALAVAGFAFAAPPAFAQTTVEELTVLGRIGPEGARTESRIVSYADLDLTTPAGQAELRNRISTTASELCTQLNTGTGSNLEGALDTCRDFAIDGAMRQMETAVAQAQPRAPGSVPPPAETAAAPPPPAPAAATYAEPAAATTRLVTNGPVPDTPENRARFGGPMSNAGKRTAPAGN